MPHPAGFEDDEVEETAATRREETERRETVSRGIERGESIAREKAAASTTKTSSSRDRDDRVSISTPRQTTQQKNDAIAIANAQTAGIIKVGATIKVGNKVFKVNFIDPVSGNVQGVPVGTTALTQVTATELERRGFSTTQTTNPGPVPVNVPKPGQRTSQPAGTAIDTSSIGPPAVFPGLGAFFDLPAITNPSAGTVGPDFFDANKDITRLPVNYGEAQATLNYVILELKALADIGQTSEGLPITGISFDKNGQPILDLANITRAGRKEWLLQLDAEAQRIKSDFFEFESIVLNTNLASSREQALVLIEQQFTSQIEAAKAENDRNALIFERDNAIALAESQFEDRRLAQEALFSFQSSILTREQQFTAELEMSRQAFTSSQNELDRALQRADLTEASRAAQAMESLRRDELDLERDQFKFSLFIQLASSPQMLFFLQESNVIDIFGDVLGTGADALKDLISTINSQSSVNIQEFGRLSSKEQGIESFRIAATTGQEASQQLRGEAPRGLGQQPPLGEPVAPGRGSTINLSR